MRIYMVRHGETVLNQKGCYYGRTDVPLAGEGERQAEKLALFFKDVSFDLILCSPLRRAVSTAEIIGKNKNVGIWKDGRLSEQDFGWFEGMTYREIKSRFPRHLEEWERSYEEYRLPGGESFLDVRRRVEHFLEDLSALEIKTLLLVAHKGTFGHFLAAALGLSPGGYWNFVFEQGCYSCVDLEDGYAIIRKLNQSV
ncbi:MAG: alpha-ribazole phosphatase [Eubacteriales bacterium]|nr:alpha-ribazole phosphatase [Eubacteriales bacterium]